MESITTLSFYIDTRPVQRCGDYNNALVNCGYYEISGYAHAQSMTTCVIMHIKQVLQEVM